MSLHLNPSSLRLGTYWCFSLAGQLYLLVASNSVAIHFDVSHSLPFASTCGPYAAILQMVSAWLWLWLRHKAIKELFCTTPPCSSPPDALSLYRFCMAISYCIWFGILRRLLSGCVSYHVSPAVTLWNLNHSPCCHIQMCCLGFV